MNKLKNSKDKYILVSILIVASILRLVGLNWDQGHFLHPDERLYVNASNISLPHSFEEFISKDSPLNPQMFYYGSFPLYIYKSVNTLFFPNENFLIISRLTSAIFSITTVLIIYLIGKNIFNRKVGLIAAFIYALTPGSIQNAHFNTTESILIFLLSTILYLSVLVYRKFTFKKAVITAILLGFSVGTKITGLTLGLIPFIVFVGIAIQRKIKLFLLCGIIFSLFFVIAAFISAPYQIIDWEHFRLEQEYMQGVILGDNKPPFTIIYERTTPYIYPLIKVVPFIFGFITLPIALLGLGLIVKKLIKNKGKDISLILLIIFPLIYFLWVGSWYAKFARYYILLIPFISIYAGYFIYKIKFNLLQVIILFLIFINGVIFIKIYLAPHTRIAASEWIYENIPSQSVITGEHWDDNLPLPLSNTQYGIFTLNQLNVYDTDDKEKIRILSQTLAASDYFITSSRRVSHSIIVNKDKYPYTSDLYKMLDENKIGYERIKEFTNYPFIFSDDFADESFQSYDHPPVIIYKNVAKLNENIIYNTLTYEK